MKIRVVNILQHVDIKACKSWYQGVKESATSLRISLDIKSCFISRQSAARWYQECIKQQRICDIKVLRTGVDLGETRADSHRLERHSPRVAESLAQSLIDLGETRAESHRLRGQSLMDLEALYHKLWARINPQTPIGSYTHTLKPTLSNSSSSHIY